MNTGQQTNFQAHQRQARKNSQRLTLIFITGIALSALAYYVITWLATHYSGVGVWLSAVVAPDRASGGDSEYVGANNGAIILSGIVALICIVIILWGFFQKKRELEDKNAVVIAIHLGAHVLPQQMNLRQQQYTNVVEEMAIASGLDCPEILYLPHDDSINGFVTGGTDESVAITVSQGALDYLTREELQALVAHEFGHIFNRDVFLNNRLSAILHGFFIIRELMASDSDDDDYYDNDSHFFTHDDDGGYGIGGAFGIIGSVWELCMIAISAGMILFGKVIQAAFSRQREWLADAHAVQYTRNKDALVGVFAKAMALQQLKVMTPEVPDDSAHFLFINYQTSWLSTHPPMQDRMARYGQTLLQEDLQALGYKLKQIKHDQEQASIQANKTQENVKQMVTQSGTMLGLVNDDSGGVDKVEAQQRFIAEKFIPLLVIRDYQKNLVRHPVTSPEHAADAVLAQFVMLSNVPLKRIATAFKWSDEKTEAIQIHIDALSAQHPSTHIQTFLHQLPMLRRYAHKQALIKQINAMIKADKSFDLCEMSYLLCLRGGLQKKIPEIERQSDFKQHQADITVLLNVAACISHEYGDGRVSNFELMKNEAMPSLSATYAEPNLNDNTVKQLYHSIQNLANTKAIYRKTLIATIERNMLLDAKLSTEQNHLLFALKKFLA